MKLNTVTRTIALLAALVPTMSWSADWVVSKVSQPSRYTVDGKTWLVVTKGTTIPNQSWISTGPRGRVVLQRAKDLVTFQPGTMAGVFEKKGWSIHTDFAQQSGTLDLSIDPQVKPHLAVQTPFLAAVVKGTVFSVSVSKKGATVGVSRGRVEVTDNRSGERTGIRAGQKASVDNDPETPMSLAGTNSSFEKVEQAQTTLLGWNPNAKFMSSLTSAPNAAAAEKASKKSNKDHGKNSNGFSSSSGGKADSAKFGKGDDSHGNSGHGNSGHGNSGKGN